MARATCAPIEGKRLFAPAFENLAVLLKRKAELRKNSNAFPHSLKRDLPLVMATLPILFFGATVYLCELKAEAAKADCPAEATWQY